MKRMSWLALIVLVSSTQWGCISLQRSPDSGYSGQGYRDSNDDEGEPTLDEAQVRNLSPEERELLEDSMLLRRLERAIATSEERAQYQKFKSTLESDKERLEFLALDGYVARERYLSAKGYTNAPRRHARDVASLIEQNDVAVGMDKQAVLESWGDPEIVERAGRNDGAAERWLYNEFVPTPEGYQQETRILYFERGRLVGWEKQ